MPKNSPVIVTVPCRSGAEWSVGDIHPFLGRAVRTMRLPEALDNIESYADFVEARDNRSGFICPGR